jgi:pilus assembly protein Flp/PilA
MLTLLTKLKTNDSGATAIEYGLIAALVAVTLIGIVTTVGTDLTALFSDVSEGLGGDGEATE